MITLIAALLIAAPQDTALAGRTRNLMPVPRAVQWGTGSLAIDSTFTMGAAGFWDQRLEGVMRRTLLRLRGRTAQSIRMAPQNDRPATLTIRVAGPGQRVQGTAEDESYTLDVSPGRASLEAATVVGAMRGLETFLQLVATDGRGFAAAGAHIEDAPRFPWRGLLVDAGRHFMPPEMVRRTLDGMAAVKLNVLHWHLSEDQGFRVESRRFPRLHGMGSDSLYYTQDDIRSIVAYARDRGIRVVPEFDMPGHSQSWFVGYPLYSAGPGPFEIERRFGVFDPVFDPTQEATYRFLDGFIGEMATLFPDAYWHIGGDEVNGVQWNANPRITAFKASRGMANNEALHTWFNQRLLTILTKHHKQMLGWDEILQPGLPSGAMIQSWRGAEFMAQAARGGHSAILSAGLYLDHQSSAEFHYLADPLPQASDLSPEQQLLILGGEACMWAEHVTAETVDSRIWPRLAAVAERLWSPREVRDVGDMYRRLRVTSIRLEELGLNHEAHTGRMLRRVMGTEGTAMRAFMDLVQPLTFDQRSRMQRPNQLTPLTFMVDVARPDPPSRWLAVEMVQAVATSPAETTPRARLANALAQWRATARQAAEQLYGSPLLVQVQPAALALDSVAAIGQDALHYIDLGQRGSAEWTASTLATLRSLEAPRGLLRVAVLDAVRQLVRLAGTS